MLLYMLCLHHLLDVFIEYVSLLSFKYRDRLHIGINIKASIIFPHMGLFSAKLSPALHPLLTTPRTERATTAVSKRVLLQVRALTVHS